MSEKSESSKADKMSPDKILGDEAERITLLDNAVAGVIRDKISQAPDGTIKINLTPSEIDALTRAQANINEMRRKNAGLGE